MVYRDPQRNEKRRGTKDYATRQSEIEDKSEQNQSTKKGFFVCGWGLRREGSIKRKLQCPMVGDSMGHTRHECKTSLLPKGEKNI